MTRDRPDPKPPSDDAANDARLPHDRDEHPQPPAENAQHVHNRQPIRQAHRDVESGIQDTERIGTPNDVPASVDGKDEKDEKTRTDRPG